MPQPITEEVQIEFAKRSVKLSLRAVMLGLMQSNPVLTNHLNELGELLLFITPFILDTPVESSDNKDSSSPVVPVDEVNTGV